MAGKIKEGRTTDYRPEFVKQTEKLARLGATDMEIADFFEVSVRTIHRWKAAHPEFCHSLKAGKAQADAEVAQSLYHRAKGYSHEAVKIVADAKTGSEHVVPYTKHYPPDTTACIFWLKNRRPGEWRDKVDHEVAGADGGPIQAQITVKFVKANGSDGSQS